MGTRILSKGIETELEDDFELLDIMLNDSKGQPPLYHPGPYWINKAVNAVKEIKKHGIKDFRGATNPIGLSYADNLFIDIRDSLNHDLKGAVIRMATKVPPINNIYESQVKWTEAYAKRCVLFEQEIINLKPRARQLLQKYNMPYSLLGNCLEKARLDNEEFSIHYLNLLEQHDNIASMIDFGQARSVFEIGGGFGVNTHLLLENYRNIKKVLFLEIPPTLYVGTQYLKAIYGESVYDYRELKKRKTIQFSDNTETEIFCIAPWQIENFKSGVDVFLNQHSFVEIPAPSINNYLNRFNTWPDAENTAIGLVTYDNFDPKRTMDPALLPGFFNGRRFENFQKETLINSSRRNIYFVSPGKLSFTPKEF